MTTTPRPWPTGTRPTATQLLDYLRTITTEEELDNARVSLNALLEAADTAHRCTVMDHDAAMIDRGRLATRVALLEHELTRAQALRHPTDTPEPPR